MRIKTKPPHWICSGCGGVTLFDFGTDGEVIGEVKDFRFEKEGIEILILQAVKCQPFKGVGAMAFL